MASPSIACIGIIGKDDNPLHTTLFPPHQSSKLDFSFLLNSSLDIFEIRQKQGTIDQDLGLLQAVDERLATYGWLTNTGVKFVVVVDMAGRAASSTAEKTKGNGGKPVVGLRDSDLRPAFRAIHTAYIQLLQNPFYTPDDHLPLAMANRPGAGSMRITSKKFSDRLKKIGEAWAPGVTEL